MLKRIFLYLLLVVTFPIASYYGLVRGAPAASVPLLCLCSYAMLTTAWPPMRRWRLTRIARTVATIAACVTLAAWIVSITASVCVPYAPARALGLAHGSLVLHSGVDFSGKPLRFRAQLTPITLRAQYSSVSGTWSGGRIATVYYYAIWPGLVALIVPSLILWLVVPRPPPPGFCQSCGYNLTGNVSGRCPECGTKVKREDQAA